MNVYKSYILVAVVAVLAGTIYFINSNSVKRGGSGESAVIVPRTYSGQDEAKKEEKMKRYEPAKEITTPDGFINTDGKPITIGEFVGKKTVLIDFWTYSCINCQRTTPYLNAWYEKYKDKGLVIVGIHTPEFEFEKDYNNVETAVEKFGIKFPVVLDNDYSTWVAYKNRYWPRKYLIDIDGFVVYDHIGEGAYEETEAKIQEVLRERNKVLGIGEDVGGEIVSPEKIGATPRTNAGSPEIYFGASRNELLGNGTAGRRGVQSFTEPKNISLNTLYLGGQWDITDEYAENKGPAKIIFRYKAQYVYMVASAENTVRAKILIDGRVIQTPGKDVDENGFVTIQKDQLYTLAAGLGSEEHTLEIIIESPGLRAFTFTFG